MKKKALALAGCVAFAAPSASIAEVLPDNLVGLNLGEIEANSFINQPFKGVIPFLFTSYENSSQLNIRLAPESVFNQIGAEKLPILNDLTFQVVQQDNKPVILISSVRPIQLPFLNFVLEIEGPEGVVYQDYTVLLDPASNIATDNYDKNYIDIENAQNVAVSPVEDVLPSTQSSQQVAEPNTQSNTKRVLNDYDLLLASLPSTSASVPSKSLTYTVKSGDSLSKIAREQRVANDSLKTLSRLIYQKNPNAFIRGDVNKIKKGAVLNLPARAEITGFDVARTASQVDQITIDTATLEALSVNLDKKVATPKNASEKTDKNTYTVVKGDSLSAITKKFVSKGTSFTKMMNAILQANPEAFSKGNKNILKENSVLTIPTVDSFVANDSQPVKQSVTQETKTKVEPQTPVAKESVEKKPKQIKALAIETSNTIETTAKENGEANKATAIPDVKQYEVKYGDNLTKVAQRMAYDGVPFTRMMKIIYAENPQAFLKKDLTKLIAGATITIPAKYSDVKTSSIQAAIPATDNIQTGKATNSTSQNVNSAPLEKRIRELRADLASAKSNLSDMQLRLNEKNTQISGKSTEFSQIQTNLDNIRQDASENNKGSLASIEAVKAGKSLTDSMYTPKSKAELAKLARESMQRKMQTAEAAKAEGIRGGLVKAEKNGGNPTADSEHSLVSGETLAYGSLALILGLLLLRYRRQIYSYTYSKINYDQPSYYPAPDADKYELKETNINFSDPKMDEESGNYDFLTEEDKIFIDPNLVEATKESPEIEHCEHLVTELFDDLAPEETEASDTEWKSIEKVCDNYIEKIKEDEDMNPDLAEEEGEATDFEHMMSDLLESLNEVDDVVEANETAKGGFTELSVEKTNITS